jgi:hypothetical protein
MDNIQQTKKDLRIQNTKKDLHELMLFLELRDFEATILETLAKMKPIFTRMKEMRKVMK